MYCFFDSVHLQHNWILVSRVISLHIWIERNIPRFLDTRYKCKDAQKTRSGPAEHSDETDKQASWDWESHCWKRNTGSWASWNTFSDLTWVSEAFSFAFYFFE